MTKAEQFAKLNGIEWHELYQRDRKITCSCGVPVIFYEEDNGETVMREGHINSTFTDAKSILEVMMKRKKDFYTFISTVGADDKLDIYYILNPDRLLDVAIAWCISHNTKNETQT